MSSEVIAKDSKDRPARERARAISTVAELPSVAPPSVNGGEPRRRRRMHVPEFSVPKHEEQPHERMISDKDLGASQMPSVTAFWWSVTVMLQYIQATILMNVSLRETEVGKEWLGILDRRIEWMKEDEMTLMAAIMDNWLSSSFVDDTEMKQVCRRQEDRLRRLQNGAVAEVASKHTKAMEEVSTGLTYDKKVQSTLRETYEQCSRARKAFVQEVEKAKAPA